MSQVNPSSPGANLAAELLLNRVQNGDVKLSSGKTTNIGSRLMSMSLSSDSSKASAGRENMDYGYAIASATQDFATAGRNVLGEIQNTLNSTAVTAANKTTLIANINTMIDDFASAADAAKVNGNTLFGAANDLILNDGMGGTIKMNKLDAPLMTTTLTALKTAVTALDETDPTKTTAALTALTTALGAITKIEGIYSAKAGSLANQSLLAEGVAGGLDTAASQQYVSGTGGASGLLNNMMA